jgi:hypothetical protein
VPETLAKTRPYFYKSFRIAIIIPRGGIAEENHPLYYRKICQKGIPNLCSGERK